MTLTDHPESHPEPAVAEHGSRFVIDTSFDEPQESFRRESARVFYHKTGHFHFDYSRVVVNRGTRIVEIYWSGGMKETLSGKDAFEFLKITRDKQASLFRPN